MRSKVATQILRDLLALPPGEARSYYRAFEPADWTEVLAASDRDLGTPFGLWERDPVGFVEDVLGESTWSKQREVLTSLTTAKRVAVPTSPSTGKTHIAARALLWRSVVYPIGTSMTVTTATRMRQVERQLWPHVRKCVAKSQLPLTALETKLTAPTDAGPITVAYGFSAPPGDEAAIQGIHEANLFIVVDEAGGIGRVIGEALRGLMTGGETRMLAIGNPATDDEGSWFESLTQQPDVDTITISAYDAPQQTGERIVCKVCPPVIARHDMGIHLVGQDWVDETIREYGEDSPYVQARVHARFPHGGPSRIIPSQWIENAADAPEPEGDQWRQLNSLGLEGETDPWVVQDGAWVRLGVDVAADGGDELVVSRSVGDLFTVRQASSGTVNADAVQVAGKILTEIKQAEQLRHALRTDAKVRVKIDAIGVGWGVAGILTAWGKDGLHSADIVPVKVSEGTGRDDPNAAMRPYRQRDEMWVAMRGVLSPAAGPMIRLRVDARTRAQLAAPTFSTNSGGYTVVETKKSMKARGVTSPDRGEACLLCLFEPLQKPVRRARLLVG